MSLFCVLYLPEPDFDLAPVGEELMEWLNTYYVEPSTDEGKRLTDLDRPWEDEFFWSYVQRLDERRSRTNVKSDFLS